jgi:parvulin-like peptidyl-prolyl isomerase
MPGDSAAAGILELPPDRLPEAYAQGLEGLEAGQARVVETPTGYSVVIARGTAGGEPVQFEQVAPRIRQQIAQQKAEEAFVTRLREQVYVDVRVEPEEVLEPAG